ncbi:hypothetical protein J3R83DRAFT_7506 [Lanmaoa asiatica]|nr:hypothetical protein J3R83DRAFT_7506 [Lanmaoa asiatica]
MAHSPDNNKQVHPKLTNEQRQYCCDQRLALGDELANAKKAYAQAANVNPWNAFLKSKLHEVNAGHEVGKQVKLTDYVTKNKDTLRSHYEQVSPLQQQEMNNQVQIAQAAQPPDACTNPKAVSNPISVAFTTMDHKWTSLCASTGIEGFYIAVYGSINDLSAPKLFFSEKAEKFLKAMFDIEPQHLALCVSYTNQPYTLDLPSTSTQCPLNKLVSECQVLIQEELDYILKRKKVSRKVTMNYNNFECHIVEQYSVALTGWPFNGPIKNPGKLGGRADLERLLNALKSEECK